MQILHLPVEIGWFVCPATYKGTTMFPERCETIYFPLAQQNEIF